MIIQVKRLNWTYVHAIAVTGSYGERGMDSFRAAADYEGICVDGSVHKIARGVVMFVDEDNLRRILYNLDYIIQRNSTFKNYFLFVASDSWGTKRSVPSGYHSISKGTITIAPDRNQTPGYNEYFLNLSPGDNIFLQEYWEYLNCTSTNTNFRDCFKQRKLKFNQEAYVSSVVTAVKLVANALHKYILKYCGGFENFEECEVSKNGFNGTILQSFYRNVSLSTTILSYRSANPKEPPVIDANGDGIGRYAIYQLDSRGSYQKVGFWHAGKNMNLDLRKIRYNFMDIFAFTRIMQSRGGVPRSVCSLPCNRNYYKAYNQDQRCCWTCIPCDPTTSIVINETSCVECPAVEVPNRFFNACRPIRPEVFEFKSVWVLVPSAFSLLGLFATLFVIAVFIRYSATPVVKASGRELCYCMLFGIGLCYCVTFILLAKPTPNICAASRILIGLSMSVVYSAILTKTNRLARVFSPKSAARPGCILPKAQIAICGAIVSVQVVGSLVWLIWEPPGVTIQQPTRSTAVLTCKATAAHLVASLLYNMVLILACTIYAFKTRKIPENFNETRLIGFTMYSTSPIYFATQNNFKIQITSLCMAISLSGTVALCCFFAPKVYIVIWQPDKNIRSRQSAVGRLVNQQMRFISQITAPSAANEASFITSTENYSTIQATQISSDPEVTSTSIVQTSQASRSPATARTTIITTSTNSSIVNEPVSLAISQAPLIPYNSSLSDVQKESSDSPQSSYEIEMMLKELAASSDVTFL
uniref:G_PROTEIN_RECEP_F3_4 domain-containing protein n=1 Tax=Syphacia muris TaxID=451379 RepID=A0A0N5B082_9BILA